MANPLLGAVLGSVFAGAMRGPSRRGPFGAGPGAEAGGLGELLGGMVGRGRTISRRGRSAAPLGGNRGALLALMLPFALRWVQRQGGVAAVLERLRQKGFPQQASSWVSTGPNEALDPGAIQEVVGADELSRLSNRLGVPQQDVEHGFAEILPEMVDQLSPQGQVPPEADEALEGGVSALEKALREVQTGIAV